MIEDYNIGVSMSSFSTSDVSFCTILSHKKNSSNENYMKYLLPPYVIIRTYLAVVTYIHIRFVLVN